METKRIEKEKEEEKKQREKGYTRINTSIKRTPDWIDNSSIGLRPWNTTPAEAESPSIFLENRRLCSKGMKYGL